MFAKTVGGEVLTFEVGRGAARIGEELWPRHKDPFADPDYDEEEEEEEEEEEWLPWKLDPLRRKKGGLPRALIFDARQPQSFESRLAITEGLAVFSDESARDAVEASINDAKKRQKLGVDVPVPFFAGSEAVSNFHFFSDGLREGGILGRDWWDTVDDALRRELELCDALRGALMIVDADHGGFAGVATTLLHDLEDECHGAVKTVYAAVGENDEDKENDDESKQNKMLRSFARSYAVYKLHEPADALIPIDLRPPDSLAAAIDLTTMPFRRKSKSIGLREWRSTIAGADLTKKLATLAYSPDLVPLFTPWKSTPLSEIPDDLVHKHRRKVRAQRGGFFGACTEIHVDVAACVATEASLAAPFLRTTATTLQPRKNIHAHRAATHFGLQGDDLDDIYTDLIKTSGFYLPRDSAYSFPGEHDDDRTIDDSELFEDD